VKLLPQIGRKAAQGSIFKIRPKILPLGSYLSLRILPMKSSTDPSTANPHLDTLSRSL
jgi:hypothetical protein